MKDCNYLTRLHCNNTGSQVALTQDRYTSGVGKLIGIYKNNPLPCDLFLNEKLIVMGKTKVKIIEADHTTIFNVGDIGYIDGYVSNKVGIVYAIVVVGCRIDNVNLNFLEIIPSH